jgi:flagellar basal body-associated protein FliL
MAEEEAKAPEENAAAEGEAQAPEGEAAQAPEEAAPKPPSMLVPMLLTSVLSIGGAYAIFQFAVVPSLVGGFKKVIEDSNGTLTFQLVQSGGGGGGDAHAEGGDAHAEGGDAHAEGGDAHGDGGDGHGDEGKDGGDTAKGETDAGAEVPIVEDGDFIVINPSGAGNRTFLMVEIYLVRLKADDNGFPEAVKKNRKRLQALIITELSAMTVEVMSDSSTRGGMSAELKGLFGSILGKAHPIKEVVISKWVMQ